MGQLPLVATVDLARGAKITSLRSGGVEWLLQGRADAIPDRGFIESGLAGWDECLPSIERCVRPGGQVVPDHGEVWARRWSEGLDGWTQVATDDFVMSRRIRRRGLTTLVEYALRSTARWPQTFLWAAHPQFWAPAGTKVELAADTLLEVYPADGRTLDWSAISSIDQIADGAARKVFLPQEAPVTSVSLVRPDGHRLRIGWDRRLVPHLGIWWDRRRFAHEPVIALEPGIGWYDNLNRAESNGSALCLGPGARYRWWLTLDAFSC